MALARLLVPQGGLHMAPNERYLSWLTDAYGLE
jgi:hypothetical protein